MNKFYMSKALKKILTTSAAFVMLAGIGAGMSSLSTNAHASRVYLDQYASAWEKRDGITHWGVMPKRGTYFKHGIPRVRYYTKTFYKNGHSFIVKAVFDGPGEIIGMDGTTHVSSARIRRALAPRHHRRARRHYVRRHARKHARRHARRHYRRHARRRY